ncbi:MAG TPA: S1C family serine protease [Opitutales bacterium]|nr:S1C family serine protease [Opitutales bacterium]
MMRLAGSLAAGRAAIFAICAFGGQSLGQAATAALSEPAADTAPTVEKPAITSADDLLQVLQQRYITLFDKYHSAVVRVNIVPSSPASDTPQIIVLTGFFISRNGDILTTHATDLQNNSLVYVDFEGVRYRADVLGTDSVTDLALLHLSPTPKNFTVLDLADSPQPPPVSTMLMAITSKLGLTPGPSTGMVQGFNVNLGNIRLPTLLLRVNIPCEGAEGGSPVLDLQGRLVGILLGGLQGSQSSFVLPTHAAQRVRDDLQTHGKVSYGQFGFEIKQESDQQTGVSVVISSVDYDPRSPALAAGLKVGDVLKSIGNTTINSDLDLRQVWFFSRPGQELPVTVQRGGQTLNMILHAGEMPVASPPADTTEPKPSPTPPAAGDAAPPPEREPELGAPLPVVPPKSK